MTYKVPPTPADPKQRYVVVTDGDEIAAIQRNGWGDPDGKFDEITQQWVATAHSMQQYRNMVRAAGLEPATSEFQTQNSTN